VAVAVKAAAAKIRVTGITRNLITLQAAGSDTAAAAVKVVAAAVKAAAWAVSVGALVKL